MLKSDLCNVSSVYNINDPLGLRLLTRLMIGLSHRHSSAFEHRFRHNFQDSVNPLYNYSIEVESASLKMSGNILLEGNCEPQKI